MSNISGPAGFAFGIHRALLLGLLLTPYLGAESIPAEPYRITAERIHLRLFPREHSFSCIDTLSLSFARSHSELITIRLMPFYHVSSLMMNGRPSDFTLDRDGLHLLSPSDSTATLIIDYKGEIAFASEFSRLTSEGAILKEEEVLPDGPKLLNTLRIAVTVPSGWSAVTVGSLSRETTGDDSTTMVWEEDQWVPEIGWICAGRYARQTISSASIGLSAYLRPEDSSQASPSLSVARDLLHAYGAMFSPYRFRALKIVEIEDWVAGKGVLAIAAPTFVMIKKIAFETEDAFNQAATILPHEVAHQWWACTIRVPDEDQAFLLEGLCEYSSLLFAEVSGVPTPRDSLNHHPLLRSLLLRIQQGKDVPLQQRADLRSLPTHYLKAAYVHHMLRQVVGDSVFKALLREFAQQDSIRSSLDRFQSMAEQISGRKLGWFFDQWVRRSGIPHIKLYNVRAVARAGSWTTSGRVRVVGYEKFSISGAVSVRTMDSTVLKAVELGVDSTGRYQNDVPFAIKTDAKPLRAVFDARGDLLKVQRLPVRMGEFRDPSDAILVVGSGAHADTLRSLARRDSARMDEGGWSVVLRDDSSMTLGDLQRGHVVLYGLPSENRLVADLQNRFPLGMKGDSVIVNGETVFDSSLALLQAIENPYNQQRLMIWVAPLSARARPEFLPYDRSWILVRAGEEIASGTWEVRDDDLDVEVP